MAFLNSTRTRTSTVPVLMSCDSCFNSSLVFCSLEASSGFCFLSSGMIFLNHHSDLFRFHGKAFGRLLRTFALRLPKDRTCREWAHCVNVNTRPIAPGDESGDS